MGAPGRLLLAGAGALVGSLFGQWQLGFAIGSVLGAALFPKKRDYGPDKIANLQFQTTAKGTPVPVMYGRMRVAGNIIWYGNFKTVRESGGKGGKGGQGGKGQQQDVRYTASFAVSLGEGMPAIDAVHRIWANKTLIDMVRYGSQITVYKGTEVQVADPTIVAAQQGVGSVTPFRQDTRIVNGTGPQATTTSIPVLAASESIYYFGNAALIGGARPRVLLTRVASAPAQDQYTINYDTGLVTFGGSYSSVTMFLSYQQSLSGVQDAIGYRYTSYVVFKDWDLGNSTTVPNFTFEVTRRTRVRVGEAVGVIAGVSAAERRAMDTGALEATFTFGGSATAFRGKYRYVAGVAASAIEVRDVLTGNLLQSVVPSQGAGTRVLAVRPAGIVTGAPGLAGQTKFRVFDWTGPAGDTPSHSWNVEIGDGFWDNGYAADLDEKYVYLVAGPNRRLWIYSRTPDDNGNPTLVRGPLFLNRTEVTTGGLTEVNEMVSAVTIEGGLLYVYWIRNETADGSNGELRVYDTSGRSTDQPGLVKLGAAIFGGGATSSVWPLVDTWTGLQSFLVSIGANPPIPQMDVAIGAEFMYVNKQNSTKTLAKCFKLSDKTLKWSQAAADAVGLMYFTRGAKSTSAEGDENLAWIAYDLATHTRYGAGLATSRIDLDTFAEASVHIAKHKLHTSPAIRDRGRMLQQLDGLLLLVDCFMVFSEGKLKMRIRKTEANPKAITTAAYTAGSGVALSREGSADIINRTLVHYVNRANDYTPETAEAKDDWLVSRREGRELEIGAEAVTNPEHARKLAYRVLWARAYKRLTGHIPAGPQDGEVEPADVLSWTDADLGLSARTVRVIGIGEEKDGRIGLDVIEENPDVLDWHAYPAAEFAVLPVIQPTAPAGHTRLDVMELGPVTVNGNPSIVMIVSGIDRAWNGARIYVSNDDVTYTRAAEVEASTLWGVTRTTLPAAASQTEDTVTTFDVELLGPDTQLISVTDAQWRAGMNRVLVGTEVIYFKTVTLVSGQRFTLSGLLRGMELTTAPAHAVNDGVAVLNQYLVALTPVRGTLPLLGIQPVQTVAVDWMLVNRTLYFKAASVSVMGEEQSLADVRPVTLVYKARGGQPTRVNNLRFRLQYDDYFPSDATDSFDRADSTSLGSNWSENEQPNVNAFQIVSLALFQRTAAWRGYAAYVGTTFRANQYSRGTFASIVGIPRGGVGVRLSGSVNSPFTGYYAEYNGTTIRLMKFVAENIDNGAGTELAVVTKTISAGQTCEIRALNGPGTTALVQVLVAGVIEMSHVDAIRIESGSVGFASRGNGGINNDINWSTWTGGNAAPALYSGQWYGLGFYDMGTSDTAVSVRADPNRNMIVAWGYTDVSIQEDSELELGTPDGKDPNFDHYRVVVRDGATIRRTVDSHLTESFEYTEDMNESDNAGAFDSDLIFDVYIVGRDGSISDVQTLVVSAKTLP